MSETRSDNAPVIAPPRVEDPLGVERVLDAHIELQHNLAERRPTHVKA